MLYTPLTKKAIVLAYNAHINQKDKSGLPYIFHPWEVANQLNDEACVCVALLHDIIEDTNITYDDLRNEGFSEEIIEGIKGVTKQENEDYMDFVTRAKSNNISRLVKIADLRHNMDLTRMNEITEFDIKRYQKYEKALKFLLED